MRIGRGPHAQVFRTLIGAGPLGKTHEESLIRRKAVGGLQVLAFVGVFPRDVAQYLAAQVGHIFTQGKLAVDVDVIHNHILSVLVLDALGAFVELLPVFLGPPVFQIAFGVILAALIVKTVGQLMPNGASGIAVVGSVVDLGVVQGRLQESGRMVDVVHLGVVIG